MNEHLLQLKLMRGHDAIVRALPYPRGRIWSAGLAAGQRFDQFGALNPELDERMRGSFTEPAVPHWERPASAERRIRRPLGLQDPPIA